MKLNDLIAASDPDSYESDLTLDEIKAILLSLQPRGFISDFTEFPYVAQEEGGDIMVSQKPSWFACIGFRATFKIQSSNESRRIQVGTRHSVLDTLFLVLIYSISAFILIFFLVQALIQVEFSVAIYAILGSALFFGFGAAANAWIRVAKRNKLNSMKCVLKKIKTEISKQTVHAPPASASR